MTTDKPGMQEAVVFAYDESEDRLVLTAYDKAGAARAGTLTRRVTGRLVNAFAALLARSSPLARSVPRGMSDDVNMLEHRDAVMRTREHDDEEADPQVAPEGVHAPEPEPVALYVGSSALPLITHIVIDMDEERFRIALRHKEVMLTALLLTRSELHVLVKALKTRAERVGWNLTIEAAWLRPGEGDITIN